MADQLTTTLPISRFAGAALGVATLLLSGCTLVDQRTFQRAGKAPAAEAVARSDSPPLPLLTIRFEIPDIDIRSDVAAAVEAAQARKPDAEYQVVAPISVSAPADVQQSFIRQGQEDTAKVVSALGYAGVSLDQVRVAFQSDAGSPAREVRVFVR